MGICVNLLHRHPKELRGILDMGDIWDLVALRSVENEEMEKRLDRERPKKR
mgnify:CR=1 FL=1